MMKKIIIGIVTLLHVSFLMAMEAKEEDQWNCSLKSYGDYFMAQIYEMGQDKNGQGVVRDFDKAAAHYKRAAEQGIEEALVRLAQLYLNDEWAFKDPLKAEKILTDLVNRHNNMEAQFYLAVMYQLGQGVPVNIEKAIQLYESAAAQGSCDALHNLSHIYAYGIGVNKDEKKAFDLNKRAATLGSPQNQYILAKMYFEGYCCEVNQQEEMSWLRKAAHGGYPQALFELAVLRGSGVRGVKVNVKKSTKFYREAAYLGHAEAQCSLAFAHAIGRGGRKNLVKAKKWYEKAIENGCKSAKVSLELLMKIQEESEKEETKEEVLDNSVLQQPSPCKREMSDPMQLGG